MRETLTALPLSTSTRNVTVPHRSRFSSTVSKFLLNRDEDSLQRNVTERDAERP